MTHFGFVEFPCPFCGRYARADDSDPNGTPFVIHAVPMCETFEKLDALSYMKAVNKATKAPL
jgi:hypothetical protein